MFIRLTAAISVSPQISVTDVAEARDQGFAVIINNRPDDEQAGQPTGAEIAAAARVAGLHYVAIPVDHSGLSLSQVEAMQVEMADAKGPVLAYCRSGTRSTHLWALAEARTGGDPDAIVAAAEAGGFPLKSMLPMLKQIAGMD